MTPLEIYAEACEAGRAAATTHNYVLGPEECRGLDCGFAWVVLKPATSAFARALVKGGKGHRHWRGGLELSSWECGDDQPTQSIGVKQAACRAFVSVLQRYGIKAYSESRLD